MVQRKNETPGGVCQKNKSINQATMRAARPYRQGEWDILEPHEKGYNHRGQYHDRDEGESNPLPAAGALLGMQTFFFLILGFGQSPIGIAVGHGSYYSDASNSNLFWRFDKCGKTITSYLKLSKVEDIIAGAMFSRRMANACLQHRIGQLGQCTLISIWNENG